MVGSPRVQIAEAIEDEHCGVPKGEFGASHTALISSNYSVIFTPASEHNFITKCAPDFEAFLSSTPLDCTRLDDKHRCLEYKSFLVPMSEGSSTYGLDAGQKWETKESMGVRAKADMADMLSALELVDADFIAIEAQEQAQAAQVETERQRAREQREAMRQAQAEHNQEA